MTEVKSTIGVYTGKGYVIDLKELIASLRKCAATPCVGCAVCDNEHCEERRNELLTEAADVLAVWLKESEREPERAEPDKIGQNRTYTVPEIIRLVQRVVSDATCGMDTAELCIAYEVERGVIAELMEGEVNGSNI